MRKDTPMGMLAAITADGIWISWNALLMLMAGGLLLTLVLLTASSLLKGAFDSSSRRRARVLCSLERHHAMGDISLPDLERLKRVYRPLPR